MAPMDTRTVATAAVMLPVAARGTVVAVCSRAERAASI